MADDDITLDGKPLQSLRVADLKAALEQRNLPKTGQKNALIKRLKGALMLENLHKSSSSHGGIQPNSQIGEEMSQNSFIQQYLAKQQELLRQRLEREAQQENDDECGSTDDKDHLLDSFVTEQSSLARTQDQVVESFKHGLTGFGSEDGVHGRHDVESQDPTGSVLQRAGIYQGQQEPAAPSPPRAVASLSVHVVDHPECQKQKLPPAVPRIQEKANTAPCESTAPVLYLSRSAGMALAAHEDSDERDTSDDNSDDDDWGSTASRRSSRVAPQPQPPSVAAVSGRSKRKLQPPQHIPPPQLPSPLQLRHPTPPPSPPPNLFPLPDTPKQSPPDSDQHTGEGSKLASFPTEGMQRQDSDSSSCSSSPEPPNKRRPGPLSLLVHKMESEQAFDEAQSTSAADMSGEDTQTPAGYFGRSGADESSVNRMDRQKQQEDYKGTDEKGIAAKVAENQNQDFVVDKKGKSVERQEKPSTEKLSKNKNKRQGVEMATTSIKTPDQMNMSHSSPMVMTEAQESGVSSDSDSSSRSLSSSEMKNKTTSEEADQKRKKDGFAQSRSVVEKPVEEHQKGEVSEPSAAAITEEEPDSESSMALPAASGAEPENSEVPVEESTTPKAFAARKISLTSNKMSPASAERGVTETEAANAGRKRRWGSSTASTAKKPSISITTDSLKSLIPDIKVNQEAVVDLPAEELQYSGDEDTMDSTHDEQDNGLKIQRTVTQVVSSNNQKNGGNEEDDGEKIDGEKLPKVSGDRRQSSLSEEITESTTSPKVEETKKVSPSETLVRRSISQQKSGVSITIDDPIRTNRQPSPPRGKVSNIIHVTNLVRPFTLGQLKELLNQTGSLMEDGFWIDKIKSHCYVTYSTTEEAVTTRNALHGVKWPQSNPKVLSVDFCEQDELDFHKGILKIQKEPDPGPPVTGPPSRLPPLMPDRDRDRDKERERDRDRGLGVVRDLWAEREREMERRERARGEREWDRDKIREFARPGEDGRRSRSRERERRRRDRAKSKERKSDKKEKGDEPPAKLLDDLFLKTKAAPCIYWLPLTEEQAIQRVLARSERKKERERIRKEMDEEDKKREEEKRERLKTREKESGAGVSGGTARRVSDGERDRDRGREGDRRRDSGHRPRRLSAGNPRRSRSRSNPRERRR